MTQQSRHNAPFLERILRDRRPGREPRELKPYLEHRILWKNPIPGTGADWENWVRRRNGKPKRPWTGVLEGFSVTTWDIGPVHAIEKVYDGPFHGTLGRSYAFVIIPTQGTTGRHRRRR